MIKESNHEVNKHIRTLQRLVEQSRRNPKIFDWQKALNDWERAFTHTILEYAEHIPQFEPTTKQAAKLLIAVEKIQGAIPKAVIETRWAEESAEESTAVRSVSLRRCPNCGHLEPYN
jgi:hypothetical protein